MVVVRGVTPSGDISNSGAKHPTSCAKHPTFRAKHPNFEAKALDSLEQFFQIFGAISQHRGACSQQSGAPPPSRRAPLLRSARPNAGFASVGGKTNPLTPQGDPLGRGDFRFFEVGFWKKSAERARFKSAKNLSTIKGPGDHRNRLRRP